MSAKESGWSASRASTGASLSSALSPVRGKRGVAGRAMRGDVEAEDALLGAADAVVARPPYAKDSPPPSLSSMSQRTLSGCSVVSQCAPTSPPVSSSATNTSFSVPRAGRQPLRASATPATASAATCDFMSSDPRPHRKPSARSPDQGSCCHSEASARTVSTWPSKHRVGPGASPPEVGYQVGTLVAGAEHVGLEAGLRDVALEILDRLALVARRVDRVEANQLLENLGALRLKLLVGHCGSA